MPGKVILLGNPGPYGRQFFRPFLAAADALGVPARIVLQRIPGLTTEEARALTGDPRTSLIAGISADDARQVLGLDTVGLCAGFERIVPTAVLGRWHRLINIHPSILPRYRGPAPTYWCWHNREQVTGFSVHVVTKEVDAGPLLYQQRVDVSGCPTVEDVDVAVGQSAAAALGTMLGYLTGELPDRPVRLDPDTVYRVPQDYAPVPSGLDRVTR
ncbi:MAG: formyltransferase family protein [Pseudonocardiaceae bacterium]